MTTDQLSQVQPAYSNVGVLQPLELRKGSDLVLTIIARMGDFNGDPYDLTGCTVKASIKLADGSGSSIDFTSSHDADAVAVEGMVKLTLSAAATGGMTLSSTMRLAAPNYHWTCDIKTAANVIVPFAYGPVTVLKGDTSW